MDEETHLQTPTLSRFLLDMTSFIEPSSQNLLTLKIGQQLFLNVIDPKLLPSAQLSEYDFLFPIAIKLYQNRKFSNLLKIKFPNQALFQK